MNFNLYSVFNVLEDSYNPVAQFRTHAAASKSLALAMREQKISPDELRLYHIGSFDNEQGILTPLARPVLISLEEFIRQPSEPEMSPIDKTVIPDVPLPMEVK